MPRQIGLLRQFVIAALLVGGATAAWVQRDTLSRALGLAAPESEDRSVRRAREAPVIVATVATSPDNVTLEAVGTGRALRSVTLRPESAGKVAHVALAAGRRFKSGDVLVRLDDADQRLATDLAQTRLEDAERTLERFERLRGSGATAASRLDEVKTAAQIARIQRERARKAFQDRVVRAPFDGVSGLPAIEEGDWIDTDDAIASFDDRSILLVEFDLPEALLARLGPGQSVTAVTPAAPGQSFEGSVSAIDSRIDAASRTVRVRVSIPNPDDLLRPGASFTVRVALPGSDYPRVPELALQFARGGLHVWRVRDDIAEQVPVRLVRRQDGAVLVDGPLAPGDRVVVEGTQRLAPGRKVTVIGSRGGGGQ